MADDTSVDRDLPHLELQCFGPPSALLRGQVAPQIVLWRKHLAVLIYLALSPDRTRSRSHLQGLLWPEKSDLHARHSLNQAVKLLRDVLGVDRLVSGPESLSLSGERLTVDVLRSTELAERQPEEAAGLLRGEFLEGFVLDDAPAFEEWAGNERARLRLRAASTLARAGEQALTALRYSEATDAARRALALEPYSELAVGLLMRAAALSGDISQSLGTFKEFATRLTTEIGEEPSRDLKGLAERVRTMRWKRFAPIKMEEEPPLVGREAIHRQAFALVEAGVSQGPRAVLITGDPGTGRTRLLVECAERLTLAGAVMTSSRPIESDQDTPWSTLRAVLRGGLLHSPGSAAADPGAWALLTGLATAASPDVGEVAAALASLIRAVGEEQPVGIAIDDAHFSDGPSLAAIGRAVSEVHSAPIMLLFTALHSWDHAPRELPRLRASVGRNLPGLALRLEQFSEAETRELVHHHSSWCQSDADRDRLARRLFFETGGNPFLLVTLLRGLADAAPLRKQVLQWPAPGRTSESQWPISVPGLARRVIMARVADLGNESARVLQAACIGTQTIDVDLVAALTDLDRVTVEGQLALLERRRFVTFDGERYVIAAPVLAEVVRAESLLPGELRTLRNRAIPLLDSRTDLESRLVRAQLLASTSPGPASFDEAMDVAQAARASGGLRTVRQALTAAERSVDLIDEARRNALKELRAQLLST